MRHWDILARQSCVKQDKAAKDKLHKQLQTWLLLIMLSFYFYYHFLSKKNHLSHDCMPVVVLLYD